MNLFSKTVIGIFILGFFQIQAQSVDEVLDKCYKATGGKEAIESVKSMKIKGTITNVAQGMTINIHYVMRQPDKMYVENEVMGMKMTAGYDGESVWAVNPMMGGEAIIMSGDEAELTKAQLEGFKNMAKLPFANWKEQGLQANYLGIQDVGDKPCHVISFIETDGSSADVYFDSVTYLMYKTSQVNDGQKIETFITERMKKNGVIYPKAIEIKVGGNLAQKLNFNEIDTNFEIDDSIFKVPQK